VLALHFFANPTSTDMLAACKMKTPATSVALFAVAAFLGAVGQYFYKAGADRSGNSLAGYLLNIRLLGGVVCYIAVMALFVAAFKRGGSMAALYPIYASTFIWAALIAWLAFGNPIRPVHIVGMALLVLGMYLMGQ
jgi:multidrug transporter EmrE-like cation transporter